MAAVRAAGPESTLEGRISFRVAPTDDGFAALPEETVTSLLEDPARLNNVRRRLSAADVASRASAATVNGNGITVDTCDGVKISGVRVLQADVEASSRVIEIIGRVLIAGASSEPSGDTAVRRGGEPGACGARLRCARTEAAILLGGGHVRVDRRGRRGRADRVGLRYRARE